MAKTTNFSSTTTKPSMKSFVTTKPPPETPKALALAQSTCPICRPKSELSAESGRSSIGTRSGLRSKRESLGVTGGRNKLATGVKVEEVVEGKGTSNGESSNPGANGVEDDKEVWVECENCNSWYHWSCVSPSPNLSPSSIFNWFCPPCLSSTPSLSITYHPSPSPSSIPQPQPQPTRKSSRTSHLPSINYSNLHSGLEADPVRWVKLLEGKGREGEAVRRNLIGGEGGRKVPKSWRWKNGKGGRVEKWIKGDGWGEELEDDQEVQKNGKGKEKENDADEEETEDDEEFLREEELDESGMSHPIVLLDGKIEGLKIPENLTVEKVTELVGGEHPVEVIDVASQTSLSNWTMSKFLSYYTSPPPIRGSKILNVISLEVSSTPLGDKIQEPDFVREMDWVRISWPKDEIGKTEEVKGVKVGKWPKVQKYCLMSVGHCWTDWHVDFAGSSVFYHVVRGSKIFYFIRPTPSNLKAYEKWSSDSDRQDSTWLGAEVDKVYRVEFPTGSTAVIPSGWIHAVYTPEDSLVIGGNFLHSYHIPTQLAIYQIEVKTKVPKKFRFPLFEKLCWYVANSFRSNDSSQFLRQQLLDLRVLRGLLKLSEFLEELVERIEGKTTEIGKDRKRVAKESVPSEIVEGGEKGAREWLEEWKGWVREKIGEERLREWESAEAGSRKGTPAEGAKGRGTKRKRGESELGGGKKAGKKSNTSTAANGSSSTPNPSDGVIISRQNLPPQITNLSSQPRPDFSLSSTEPPMKPSDVRVTVSIQEVIRSWGEDELGRKVFEKRTVRTEVERWVVLGEAEEGVVKVEEGEGVGMDVDGKKGEGGTMTEPTSVHVSATPSIPSQPQFPISSSNTSSPSTPLLNSSLAIPPVINGLNPQKLNSTTTNGVTKPPPPMDLLKKIKMEVDLKEKEKEEKKDKEVNGDGNLMDVDEIIKIPDSDFAVSNE